MRKELRQLPDALAKVAGGFGAACGAVGLAAGFRQGSTAAIALSAVAIVAGVWLFVRSARWMAADDAVAPDDGDPAGGRSQDAIAWGLLAGVVVALIALVLLVL